MGWPEAFPIPNKKADITVHIFIKKLPFYTHVPLSHTVKQWNRIQEPFNGQCSPLALTTCFLPPITHKVMEKVFHKYLKPTLKKLCENDPYNWDKYINEVLASS